MRIAGVLIGLGFTAVFAFVAYLATFDTPYRYELNCSRAGNVCRVDQRTIARSRPSWSLPLDTMTGAEVRVFRSRRGAPRIMLYLTTPSGSYYFADYGRRASAEQQAAKIRSYLAGREEALNIVKDDSLSFYVIFFGFVVIAGLIGFLWKTLLRLPAQRLEPNAAVDTRVAAS